ncbi:MAG: hypothetical protein LBI45_02010 [Bacteroidales bacterium]|jgi:hypothetical protein|nr:hypothetical protein [Bacteroidales bacterium]
MIEPTALNLQVFDYYSYNVMRNFVFAEQKPFIQSTYTYEENGVYYCASGTEKGVYRYSYCRNNPLHYIDPTGQKISGYNAWSMIMFFPFLPARLLSEAFSWIDDKINGNTRYGSYFAPSYLIGQTGPGTLTPYNSVNTINYGEPGYLNHGPFVDKPISSGWIDLYHDILMNKEYVRKIGSKQLLWIPRKVAASGGSTLKTLGKIITGIFVGDIEGTNVYETIALGKISGNYNGVTIPERGIAVGLGVFDNDKDMIHHEFGHILQYRKHGARAYWSVIGPESIWSAAKDGKNGWEHRDFWTETYANYLARNYFGLKAFSEGWDSYYWNYKYYPVENISPENLLKLSR